MSGPERASTPRNMRRGADFACLVQANELHTDVMSSPRPSSREALIQAGLAIFGRDGHDGASTREIAVAAGMPMSQITYHFGGKHGLYLACAQQVADTLSSMMAPALAAIDTRETTENPAVARAMLHELFGVIVPTMLSPQSAPFVRFIMREQAEPTEAFAILYGGMMGQMLARIAHLIGIIAGPGSDPALAQVHALTLIGQVVVFRVAHSTVMRSTGWPAVGEAEIAVIRDTILFNIDAICTRIGAETSSGEAL